MFLTSTQHPRHGPTKQFPHPETAAEATNRLQATWSWCRSCTRGQGRVLWLC